jgi:flagellum-specific peptidoglycan hydrolase FlgJ
MKKSFFLLLLLAGAVSCVTTQIKKDDNKVIQVDVVNPAITSIGRLTEQTLSTFVTRKNTALDQAYARKLARLYIYFGAKEEINHDIAFAQMCLETGFLKFGNQVKASQNNFCGLGALDSGESGNCFASMEDGVLAHIQHLKAYANQKPLNTQLLDPRFKWVKRGSAPFVDDLAGKWASDPNYGAKIKKLIKEMRGNLN